MAKIQYVHFGRIVRWTCRCQSNLEQVAQLDKRQTMIPVCCASAISRGALSKDRVREFMHGGKLLLVEIRIGKERRTFTTIESVLSFIETFLDEAEARQARIDKVVAAFEIAMRT